MSCVDFQLFKKHVRADDFSDHDDRLMACLENAEHAVIRMTGRSYDELAYMGGGTIPGPLQQVIMMVGAHLYAHPEAADVQEQKLDPFVMGMIKSYRKLADDKPCGQGHSPKGFRF